MKTTKDKNVLITMKGKDVYIKARVESWKAHLIVSQLEKDALDKKKRDEKTN